MTTVEVVSSALWAKIWSAAIAYINEMNIVGFIIKKCIWYTGALNSWNKFEVKDMGKELIMVHETNVSKF